jgi:hypothetical protein
VVAAASDEMTPPAVLKTHESPWHEDNLVLLVGLSVTCESPHSSETRA